MALNPPELVPFSVYTSSEGATGVPEMEQPGAKTRPGGSDGDDVHAVGGVAEKSSHVTG